MRPVHDGDPDRYEMVCCENFIDAPIAWAPYHANKGWDIAAASRDKDDVEAFLEPGSSAWKARALYAAPQNNPGAALAEPTTVATDLDSGDARPNRKLDSSDRGHLVPAQTVQVPVEVRKQDDAIDEIIIRGPGVLVHIEQMSADGWFMGVNAADGSYWQFWFGAKNRKSRVEFRHTEMISAEEESARRSPEVPSTESK